MRTACLAALAAELLQVCAVAPQALAQRRQSHPEPPPQHMQQPRTERGDGNFKPQAPKQENRGGGQSGQFQPNREQRQENRNAWRPNANSIPQQYRGQENRIPQLNVPERRGPQATQPAYAPPGHLGAWLNENRGVPVQQQEKMLRNDPNFSRLPQSDQQRLVRQLNRVDQMPEAQRERRLARAEALERLSPQDRAQVNLSARRWATMPPDRQTLMRQAFRDLRGVPPEQRQTVLNSGRYQGTFSPDERGILSDMLRVEPYDGPR